MKQEAVLPNSGVDVLSKEPVPDKKQELPTSFLRGYSFINPQPEPVVWDYSIQRHKNQNGAHWDLRLAPPLAGKAYSWASKKLPFVSPKPVLAMRTSDHNLEHMNFEGPMNTRRGYGTVKLIQRGKTVVKNVDEDGIRFELNGQDYRLTPLRGKKYMFEKVSYD